MIGAFVAVCLAAAGLTAQPAQAADTGSITGKVFTQAVGGAETAASYVYIYLYYSTAADGSYSIIDSDASQSLTQGFSFEGNTFNLSGLKAGFYKFEVASVGDSAYQREHYNDAQFLHDADPIQVGTTAEPVDDMVLQPAGQVTGRVTDTTGNPIADASVSFQRTANGGSVGISTDSQGYYTSSDLFGAGLVKGDYRISARHDDYDNPDGVSHEEEYWKNAATYAAAAPVTVTPGATTGNINFSLDVAPRLRLAVKDPAGNPMPNVDVGIWLFYQGAWEPYRAGPNTTDADGIFRRTLRIGDRYKYFIAQPAGGTKWYGDTYTEGTATEVSATSHGQILNLTIQLDSAPVITGAAPSISGSARSGKTLTVSPGSWGPAGVSVRYQWLANGVAIPGATATTIKLTNSQAGKRITVAATGSLAGATPVITTSAATATVTGVLTAKKVSISGTAKVGKKLRAKTSSWGPSPVKSSYTWYRNGKKIPGQKSSAYKLRKADGGKRITVRVTQKKSNYISASKLSSKTKKVKKK